MKLKNILILLLCFTFLVSPVLAVGNIISGGDFESGSFYPYWSTGGQYSATIVGGGRSGDCAQFFTANTDYSGYLTRTLDESIGSGTLTYWFKVGGLSDPSKSVWIDIYEGGILRNSKEVHAYTGSGWYEVQVTGFATTGSHNFQITVDFAAGNSGTVWIDDIVMNSLAPTVSFIPTSTTSTYPVTVDFTGTAAHTRDSPAGDQYYWTFGDGGTSSLLSPSHEYTTEGAFTVTFLGRNDFDSTDTGGSVTTSEALAAAFHTSSTDIITGASIVFTDDSSGDPTNWAWDFDNDGSNESSLQNPSYIYTSAGVKSPKLYAWKTGSSDVELKTSYITVSDDLVAAFSCTPDGGSISPGTLVVCDPDDSTGTPTAYSWDFDEGPANTSQYASHTYSNPGDFTVVLTITKPYQSDDEIKTDFFTVGNQPVVDFSGTPTTGILPFTVVFTGTNTGGAASSWSWNFGDEDSTNSTVQSPVHTYSAGGPFTVAVTGTNAFGFDTETKVGYISPGTIPGALFTANRTLLATIPNGVFQFYDNSTGTPTSWDWGWGDGTSNTTGTSTPIHNFTVAGTYTIGLRATNAFGTGWYSDSVTILDASPPGTGYSISGLVKNAETNATIGSAEIMLTNITEGEASSWTSTTYTSTAGVFSFVGLINGTYVLSSSQSGYDSYTSSNIIIDGASPDAIPISLVPSTTVPTSMRYYPHLTRFVLKDIYGNPIPGVLVTVQGYQITASHNWVLEMIGLDLSRTKLDTQSMSGITGSDGSVVFLMLEIVSYDITFSGGPVEGTPTETLFPKEDSYLYQLAVVGAGSLFEQGSSVLTHNLTARGLNYTALQFHGSFNDTTGHTSSGYFWITDTEGGPIYNQTVASNNLSVGYTLIPFTPGSMYFFGLNLTNSDYGYINYREVITAPAGRLLHPLEDRGIDTEWYKWITIIALVLFVAMFSGITNIYGSLLFPIWALFFTFIGWLDWCPPPFVIGVACLGGMIFLSKRNSQTGDG